jgi:hypothetical protein
LISSVTDCIIYIIHFTMGCAPSAPATEPAPSSTNADADAAAKRLLQSPASAVDVKSPTKPVLVAAADVGKRRKSATETSTKTNGKAPSPHPSPLNANAQSPATSKQQLPNTKTQQSQMPKLNGVGGGAVHLSSSPAATTVDSKKNNPQWKAIWERLHPLLLDPADVHATMEDLISRTTNKLSATELTFLQRKVRSVIRSLSLSKSIAPQTKNMMGRIRSQNASEETEGRAVAERYHLLNSHVIKKVLPTFHPTVLSEWVNPGECSFYLLLYMNDVLCDRVANVAVESAKRAGLEMDVNKRKDHLSIPLPCSPMEEPAEVPPGASLLSLSFLVALALRKYMYMYY